MVFKFVFQLFIDEILSLSSSSRARMFFLALLSLAKALNFSRCSFLTLAEAAEILSFIALGLAGNAYMWSVACHLRLFCGSPVAPCSFGKYI